MKEPQVSNEPEESKTLFGSWYSSLHAAIPRLRLASGLVLFVYAALHLANHALGNISLGTMEAAETVFAAFWHSLPGTVLLYAALPLHVLLTIWHIMRRNTWRMSVRQAVQLVLGLSIPYLIATHIMATRGAYTEFDINPDYRHVLSLLWPESSVSQSLLLLFVWGHGCIGVERWLRTKPWQIRLRPWLGAIAVALPVLALTGWISAARRLVLIHQTEIPFSPAEIATLAHGANMARIFFYSLLIASAVVFTLRNALSFWRTAITIRYFDGRTIRVRPGPTLLEISQTRKIPHLSVCGGHARCSTCRTRIIRGAGTLPPPSPAERLVLKRINAGRNVRLACQIRPVADLVVLPLLTSPESIMDSAPSDDHRWGSERAIAIMFVDLRGFTSLSETLLPFDVVFVLNRYIAGISRAIQANGGRVDKVIGDGVMAEFGMDTNLRDGARSALRCLIDIGVELDQANEDLHGQLSRPLRVAVGLHGGPAILGNIGLDGASGGASITALGDVVNVASRLEGIAKKYDAFAAISVDLLQIAGVKDDLLPLMPEENIRGRQEPLKVACPKDATEVVEKLAAAGITSLVHKHIAP